MARFWTKQEISFLVNHANLSLKEITQLFNNTFQELRSYDSIQKKMLNIKAAMYDAQDENDHENTFNEIDAIFENKLETPPINRKKNKEDTRYWLEELLEFKNNHVTNSITSEYKNINSNFPSLVVLLSDLHFGKKTDEYNIEIAEKRLLEIPPKIHMKINEKIDEIVICLIGDIVEGEDIYATQNTNIECSVFEQAQMAISSLWKMISIFKSLFPSSLIRVETVPGNHGRMSKTANEKSNWDNIVYYVLQILNNSKNDQSTIINSNFQQFNIVKVKKHNIGIYHEGVKHVSTPAMREKIAGWSYVKNLDILLFGHWHEWHVGNWLGKIVMHNGCLCGPDSLAEKMAKEDKAKQGYFLLKENEQPYNFGFLEW